MEETWNTGEEKYLGRGVAFCPHCDSPYYAGRYHCDRRWKLRSRSSDRSIGDSKSVTLIEYSAQLKADDVLIRKVLGSQI